MQSTTSPSASPPDFDFNLPCRYFKSSFARSLSMYNGGGGAGGGANDMQCKSLDYDVGQYRKISVFSGNNNHNNNNSSTNSNSNNNVNMQCNSLECPPLPQRRQVVGKNEANNSNSNNNKNSSNNAYLESDASSDEPAEQEEDTKPPAIPARCPIVVAKSKSASALNMQHRQQQQQQQQMLAQFRHAAIAENANGSGNAATAAAAAIHGNFNRPINHNTLPPQPQQSQQQLNGKANIANNNNEDALGSAARAGRSRCNLSNNRRNVWPTDRVDSQQQQQQLQQHYQSQQQQQQQQQDDNLMFAVEAEDDVNILADDGNATIAIAQPPVAATRSTLTAHYAGGAKPPIAARTTSACIEQRVPAFKAHSDNSANVQMVLLQNQVDTLQWQLKQVETSNEMYRAVIEEIARFLDRYQTQKQQQRQLQQQQQISRSKSLYQVYDGNSNCEGHEQSTSGVGAFGDKSIGTSSCLRTRSTSNLIVDLKQSAIHNGNAAKSGGANHMKHSSLATAAADKRSYDAINTTNNNSYATFKDFTWRRSPKKYAESKAQAAADDLEEKLNQEAFRLSRTIQNLLNTSIRQPDLTQHRNAATACNNALLTKVAKTPTTPTIPTIIPTTLITPAQNNASNKCNATVAADKHHSRTVPAANNSLANATAEMLFLRANNIRDSRLSLRSSTDSSVHSTTSNSSVVSTSSSSVASTSSGKVETDEDVTLHHPFHPISLPFKQHQHPLSSATEDESGFSSISSFQDIGVPLCSTMISNGTSTPNRLSLASVKLDTASLCNGNAAATVTPGLQCDVVETREFACDSRNSTLKSNHPGNVLGVPLQATHDMQHRWDTTTTKTSYRNANKYQRFSTLSNEEAAAVLWV